MGGFSETMLASGAKYMAEAKSVGSDGMEAGKRALVAGWDKLGESANEVAERGPQNKAVLTDSPIQREGENKSLNIGTSEGVAKPIEAPDIKEQVVNATSSGSSEAVPQGNDSFYNMLNRAARGRGQSNG